MNGSGHTQTYAELDAASNRFAHAMRALGLRQGDRIAILLPNHPRYLEIVWAAQRSGLYYVPVNHHLRPRRRPTSWRIAGPACSSGPRT
jgi:acyl-CoA synthetase (AMP-forming)/AMP-acid ligase II